MVPTIVEWPFNRFIDMIAYSWPMQLLLSPAGFWRQTNFFGYFWYKIGCWFLPYANNEIDHPLKAQYKERMVRLNRLMLVQYTNDSMVDPYQSAQFGENDANGVQRDMFETELYKNDLIGLKTLHEQGKIDYMTIFNTPNFSHLY